MIHRSPFPDVELPAVPVADYALRHAARLADKPAVIDGPTGAVLTYGELGSRVRRLAGGLLAAGFGPGDVLALLAPNCPEFVVVFHGVAATGGTLTTINPTYTEGEIRHQLQDSKASILVCHPAVAEAAQAATEGTDVRTVFTLDDLPDGPPAEGTAVDVDAVAVLPYSSGTTGLSKGVMLSHRNLVVNMAQVHAVMPIEEDEAFVVALPLFHIYGMNVLMNPALAAGATIVTMPRFDLEAFLRLHQEHRARRSFVAPPIVVALAKHPLVDQYDLHSLDLVFSGAAPLSPELSNECAARLGCDVVQGYGMTELSPVTHVTPLGKGKPGTVGQLVPNTEMAVVDPGSGEFLGYEAEGELWIRGPQVMQGYLGNEQATRQTIDDERWLHTGDIVRVDHDGYLTVVDRLKELIKYKGFQVAPAELEALLLTHPAVADAAVVGRADEEAGEVPIGFVVLKPGQEAGEDDIKGFVAERVASYKHLGSVTFLDTIPKSPSGKILRRLLRQ